MAKSDDLRAANGQKTTVGFSAQKNNGAPYEGTHKEYESK